MAQGVVLSELQLALMRVLWQEGQASTAEIARVLAEQRGLAHTTVATMLTRLEKRGVVSSVRDGRQLVYQAEVGESAVRRSMVSQLLGNLFGGDANALVAHLLREDEIDPTELQRVRQLLDDDAERNGKHREER